VLVPWQLGTVLCQLQRSHDSITLSFCASAGKRSIRLLYDVVSMTLHAQKPVRSLSWIHQNLGCGDTAGVSHDKG